MKKCPYCAEEIQDEAIVCRHCGRDLKAGVSPVQQVQVVEPKKKTSVGTIGCATIIAFLFVAWCASTFNGTPNKPSSTAPSTSVDLHGKVSFSGAEFTVTNLGPEDWTDVKLDLNGGLISSGYVYKTDALAHGDQLEVGALQFANSEGARFNPFQMKPQKMTVLAKVGGKLGVTSFTWK